MKLSRFCVIGVLCAPLLPAWGGASASEGTGAGAVPAATNPVASEPAKAPPEVVGGYLKLGFDRLASFSFVPPVFDPTIDPKATPPTGEEQIPAEVKSWNGRKAVLTGFMMPLKIDRGLVTEFLLLKNTLLCCYGTAPNLNECVLVRLKQGVPALMDRPIAFYGKLNVGAMFENGYLSGIYRLEDAKMGEIQD